MSSISSQVQNRSSCSDVNWTISCTMSFRWNDTALSAFAMACKLVEAYRQSSCVCNSRASNLSSAIVSTTDLIPIFDQTSKGRSFAD